MKPVTSLSTTPGLRSTRLAHCGHHPFNRRYLLLCRESFDGRNQDRCLDSVNQHGRSWKPERINDQVGITSVDGRSSQQRQKAHGRGTHFQSLTRLRLPTASADAVAVRPAKQRRRRLVGSPPACSHVSLTRPEKCDCGESLPCARIAKYCSSCGRAACAVKCLHAKDVSSGLN